MNVEYGVNQVKSVGAYRSQEAIATLNSDWMYVGRGCRRLGLARSPLANPFHLKGGKRGSTLKQYKQWLWGKMVSGDEDVLRALREIQTCTTLMCHCRQPGPCHAHVVSKAAAYLRDLEGRK